jgi:hypothetical protein
MMIDLLKSKEIDVDWPGWPLENNPYGADFDESARIRMIAGGRSLIPYLVRYKDVLGKHLLEIGPFFNPLLVCEDLEKVLSKETVVTFLENDPHALRWLSHRCKANIFDIDIKDIAFRDLLMSNIQLMALRTPGFKKRFDVILISQVLNYVDYCSLLEYLYPILHDSGLLFINNVIDYGIPLLFSEKRPGSNRELRDTVLGYGFRVVEEDIISSTFPEQVNDRLIMILSKR